MAEPQICSCLDAADWNIFHTALTEYKDEVVKVRKRVARAFGAVPGAIDAKKMIADQLDAMEGRVDQALTRLEATPKCGEPAGKVTKLPPVMEHKEPREIKAEKAQASTGSKRGRKRVTTKKPEGK